MLILTIAAGTACLCGTDGSGNARTLCLSSLQVDKPLKMASEMLLEVAKANCAKLLKENSVGLARKALSGNAAGREGTGSADSELPPQQHEAQHRVRVLSCVDVPLAMCQ